MLKSKIHRAHVTGANLDYEGSISLDKTLMREADILPYEQVHVLNVNNGQRFTTYAIPGKDGEVALNGAAARLAVKNDVVIILTYILADKEEASKLVTKLVYVDENNKIKSTKRGAGTSSSMEEG
jgi:aspartate 1-decarboxylase